jgi:hypothetical protein
MSNLLLDRVILPFQCRHKKAQTKGGVGRKRQLVMCKNEVKNLGIDFEPLTYHVWLLVIATSGYALPTYPL